MNIIRHRIFKKHFKLRILPHKNLVKKFENRLKTFLTDRESSELHDHRLIGKMKNFRSFSVTGDIRVVYRVDGENLKLFDIGSHNQVY